MNYDKIVDLIVEEIYKKLNSETKIENKPKAVLLFEKDKTRFDFLSDNYEVSEFNKDTRDCEILIISRLCMRGLSNLALGNSTSDEERFILKMLMKGKKVYLLNDGIEYKRYKDSAPKALYKKYVSFEDDVLNYGVQIIKDINDINSELVSNKDTKIEKEIVNKVAVSEIKMDDTTLDLTNKKLISESDLKKATIGGVKNLLVNKRAIITPLAKDFIRIYHLNLKKI